MERIEIRGLEIVGPNQEITLAEAQADRLVKSKKFLGRGIVAWSGNNIRIHRNKVHHCPHSGIRVDKGDYIAIEHNQIYSNTWWGSSAESAVVIAEATDIDNYSWTKIFLLSNRVYDNRNFIPFYNENAVDGDHDRPVIVMKCNKVIKIKRLMKELRDRGADLYHRRVWGVRDQEL